MLTKSFVEVQVWLIAPVAEELPFLVQLAHVPAGEQLSPE